MEVFSYAGGTGLWSITYGVHKDYARKVLNTLKILELNYEILDEINYFSPEKIPYDPDSPIPKDERRIPPLLPERIMKLRPCPFLAHSLESPKRYIFNAAELLSISMYTLSEKEVIKRCTGSQYINCKYYVEGTKEQRRRERE